MRLRRGILLPLLALSLSADEEKVGAPYWVSTPPAARTALDGALSAAASGDWPLVARSLQTVFDRFPAQFASPAQPGAYPGARARALSILASLPEAGRAEYERTFGPAGAELLSVALASGDERSLYEIVRRFEATEAGRLALFALADRARHRGHRSDAALLLARLLRTWPALAGDPAFEPRARRLLDGTAPTGRESGGWPMMGGDPSRAAIAPETRVRPERYFVPLFVPERTSDRPQTPTQRYYPVRRTFGDEFDGRWARYVPIQPVLARGFVVLSDGRQVRALNAYSGEELWRHPRRPVPQNEGRTNLSAIFTPVVEDGVVYATVEVPSEFAPQFLQRVPITYYLPTRRLVAIELLTGRLLWSHEELASVEGGSLLAGISLSGAPLARGDRIFVAGAASEGVFHSYAVAVEKATGAVAYATKISNGQQELNLFGRQLQEAVPTPVAAADGVLYFGTNLGVVAAVDELLGTPVWAATYDVVPIPATYLWYEAPRRWPLAENGPPLVVGDLLLVAPADGRALLALERSTGRLRWNRPYPAPDPENPRLLNLIGADADRVYVARDGVEAIWLRDDAATGARAGKVAWEAQPFPDQEVPSGRGILAQNGLFVPSPAAVYRLDPATGKLLGREEREGRDAGATVRLVAGEGILLTAGRDATGDDFLAARYDRDEVVSTVRGRLARGDPDLEALLEGADVLLAAREVDDATSAYQRARRRAAEEGRAGAEARARMGLFRAMILRAERSVEAAPERAREDFGAAIRAAPDAASREKARLRVEDLLAALDRSEDSDWRIENLERLASDHGDSPVEEGGATIRSWALRRIAERQAASGRLPAALDAYHRLMAAAPQGDEARAAAAAVEEILLSDEGRRAYAPFEERAARLFRESLARGDLEAVERGLLLYPNARAGGGAVVACAEARLRAGEAPAAVAPLQSFLSAHRDAPEAPQALLLLFEAHHRKLSHGSALAALRQLARRHPDAIVRPPGGADLPAREFCAGWLAKEPYATLAPSARRRDLEPPLVHRFTYRSESPDGGIDLPEIAGVLPEPIRDALLLRTGSELSLLEGATGRRLHSIPLSASTHQGPIVFASDRLLLLEQGGILGYDALTGRRIYRAPLPVRGEEARRLLFRGGRVFLLSRSGLADEAATLSEIDPKDGSAIWRSTVPKEDPEETVGERMTVFVGDDVALMTENPVRLTLVDTTTGKILNRVLVGPGRSTALARAPTSLPDGRVLLAITTTERTGVHQYEYSWEILLVDPARRGDDAIVWRIVRPPEARSRFLQSLHVEGAHVAALDEQRGAFVAELDTGRIVKTVPRLAIQEGLDARAYLASQQPEHDSALLALTRAVPGEEALPARLAAYTVPDLQRRYSVPVAAGAGDMIDLLDSQGVLGFVVSPGDRSVSRASVRLFDPLTGRLVQEIEPEAEEGWITAGVQNGRLVVLVSGTVAQVYGPK